MIYRQAHLTKNSNKDLKISLNNEDNIDRVYRKYSPTGTILSIPVKATKAEEIGLTIKLEHGIIDMITATKAEVIEEIQALLKYSLELDNLLSNYSKTINNDGK
jgi:hypothetical protein